MRIGGVATMIAAGALYALGTTLAQAQAPARPPYGPAVTLATAKKIAAGAMAEAAKQKWNVAVAIVDNHGMLIYYEMMDDTQTAAAHLSIEKARTAATLRRTTKELEQNIADGRVAVLALGGLPVEGGIPIVVDGRMSGAIGVSGMASPQDAIVAQAGLNALK